MNFGSGSEWMRNDREGSIDLLHWRERGDRRRGHPIAQLRRAGRRHQGSRGDPRRPQRHGLSRKLILDQVEDSLDRLGTDYIDLYQIHRWHDETPIEETLSALSHLVETGRVRYIGASTMSASQFTKALYTSDIEGFSRFACMQPEYSAVARHEEANLLPVCEGEDIGVIPWSPLSGGFLTGKYERGDILPVVNREGLRPSGSRAQPDDDGDGASHTVGMPVSRLSQWVSTLETL
ncbi:aldo/keto reductase [Halolamina sp.]|jgi:aryl-alcohol dehydrogenase-like predicted oxidoreductase|uniref:aldo/keto reductase n=1 Tax=Halolamina sp. TaxID=1940283 RepID=UPI000223B5DC|nr:aldo/keto reductase [halophilic archaeon DL31]